MHTRAFTVASLAVALLVPATAAERPTPEALDRSIRATLRSCFKHAERGAAQDNLLVAPALKNCYHRAAQAWQVATSRAVQRLGAAPDSPCRVAFAALEQEWNDYAAKVLGLESIQGMALNTDDDVELALRKHLYELAHRLSANSDCPR